MRAFLLVPALLLFASAGSAEEIYKWVDKDGNVHYGARPKDKAAEQVKIDRPGFDPEPVTEEERKAAAARKAACEEKTAEYEKYKAADVIKTTDPFGKTREFTPEEREEFVKLAREKMKTACSEAPAPATQEQDSPPAEDADLAAEEPDLEPVEPEEELEEDSGNY